MTLLHDDPAVCLPGDDEPVRWMFPTIDLDGDDGTVEATALFQAEGVLRNVTEELRALGTVDVDELRTVVMSDLHLISVLASATPPPVRRDLARFLAGFEGAPVSVRSARLLNAHLLGLTQGVLQALAAIPRSSRPATVEPERRGQYL